MKFDTSRALELLRLGTGITDATFREGQLAAIQHIVEDAGGCSSSKKLAGAKASSTLSRRGFCAIPVWDQPS